MNRTFDCNPAKRELLLSGRQFDLRDMGEVFDDPYRIEFIDQRKDYGEVRFVTIGKALNAIHTVVFTQRGEVTWLVTAWPSNRKERELYAQNQYD